MRVRNLTTLQGPARFVMAMICAGSLCLTADISLAQTDHASTDFLTDDQLRAAFSGKTHNGFYRRFLVPYGDQTFVETYAKDGTLSYTAGEIVASGSWQIDNKKICFTYDNPDFLPGCFYVTQIEGCYYSYETNTNFSDIVPGRDPWWIRSYIDGTSPDCADPELVS